MSTAIGPRRIGSGIYNSRELQVEFTRFPYTFLQAGLVFMASSHSLPVAIGGPPLYAGVVPFATVPFILVLVSDIVYWRTSNLFWQHASEWLLLAASVMGGIAIALFLLESLFRRSIRPLLPGWSAAVLFGAAYAVGIVNNFVHARDGWTGVVFLGLGLSIATVALLVLSALARRAPVYRRELGALHA